MSTNYPINTTMSNFSTCHKSTRDFNPPATSPAISTDTTKPKYIPKPKEEHKQPSTVIKERRAEAISATLNASRQVSHWRQTAPRTTTAISKDNLSTALPATLNASRQTTINRQAFYTRQTAKDNLSPRTTIVTTTATSKDGAKDVQGLKTILLSVNQQQFPTKK